jgi:hypothetical protein
MMLGGGLTEGNSRATPLHIMKYKYEANRWQYTNDLIQSTHCNDSGKQSPSCGDGSALVEPPVAGKLQTTQTKPYECRIVSSDGGEN